MKLASSSKSLKAETEYTITKMKHLFIPVILMKKQAQKGECTPGHMIPDSGPPDSKVRISLLSSLLPVLSEKDTPSISYLWHWCLPMPTLPGAEGQKHWYCASQTMTYNAEPQRLPTRTLPLKTKSWMLAWCLVSFAWIFVTPQLASDWGYQQAITQL